MTTSEFAAAPVALNDASLWRTQAFLAGRWCHADSGATQPVTDPATGRQIGTVPGMGAAEARRAVAGAQAAQRRRSKASGVAPGEVAPQTDRSSG